MAERTGIEEYRNDGAFVESKMLSFAKWAWQAGVAAREHKSPGPKTSPARLIENKAALRTRLIENGTTLFKNSPKNIRSGSHY
jgi:hypothetical protein